MTKNSWKIAFLLMIVPTFVASLFWPVSLPGEATAQEKEKEVVPAPVEEDMHEFMEYVYQPTYKRLMEAIAAEPTNNQGWKAIKADALILAESGNLLLIRSPEEDAAAWVKYSEQTREFGGQVYRAAKKKDFKTARASYESMITACNACHQQFADGEHQLKP